MNRIENRFDDSVVAGFASVGLKAVRSEGNANELTISNFNQIFDHGIDKRVPTFVSLVTGGHAVGCIAQAGVLMVFNSYPFSESSLQRLTNGATDTFVVGPLELRTQISAGVNDKESGIYRVFMYPNDAGLADCDVQGNLETEFTSEGECQELSLVIAYLMAKNRVWDADSSAMRRQKVADVYKSICKLSLSKYNDVRREAKLLGGALRPSNLHSHR